MTVARCAPLHLVIREEAKATQTAGGIHLPETAEEKGAKVGTIVSIGSEAQEKLKVGTGERVLLSKHAILQKVPGSKDLWVTAWEHVLCVLTEDE